MMEQVPVDGGVLIFKIDPSSQISAGSCEISDLLRHEGVTASEYSGLIPWADLNWVVKISNLKLRVIQL